MITELRNHAYEYMILNGSRSGESYAAIHEFSYFCSDARMTKNNILRICKQIRFEAYPILLQRTLFFINVVDAAVFAKNVYDFNTSKVAALEVSKGHLLLRDYQDYGPIKFDFLPLIRAFLSIPGIKLSFLGRHKYMQIFVDHGDAWRSAIESDRSNITLTHDTGLLKCIELGFKRDAPVPFIKSLEKVEYACCFGPESGSSFLADSAMYDYIKALGGSGTECWRMKISKSV